MKESYIKLPNITVSKLQDVVDYLDENNIEYIEEYKRDEEIDRLNNIIDKAIEYINKYCEDYIIEDSPDPMCLFYGEDGTYKPEAKKELLDILKGDNK